jgi:hypothetical protein
MTIVDLLESQATETKRTLVAYVIQPFAGIWRVLQYPLDPTRSPIIVKRFTSRQQAEDFLLSLCPRPAATKVEP